MLIIIFEFIFLLFFNAVVEFLPISSTAHSILLIDFLKLKVPVSGVLAFSQLAISLGVCFYFRKKIIDMVKSLFSGEKKDKKNTLIFLSKIFITMLPTLIFGLFFYNIIKKVFYSNRSIAICLILGAILMLFAEKKYGKNKENTRKIEDFEDIDFLTAIKIGLLQALSLIPGVSRSATTISAGLLCNLPRKFAVEFSFFISIPISILASLFEIYKTFRFGLISSIVSVVSINSGNTEIFGVNMKSFMDFFSGFKDPVFICLIMIFIISFILSLLFSLLFCKKILNFLSKNTLFAFIYYRIGFGLIRLIFSFV